MSASMESIKTQMEESRDRSVTNVTQENVDNKKLDVDVTNKDGCNAAGAAMSKSQLKKLKKKEKWEQVKALKRKAEKERYKARKRECRERGEELGPTRKQLRHNKMSKSDCKVRVVVDCDFDDYMADKDIKMLVKQIQYSYSANRRAENPLQFHCCGVNGETRQRLENIGDYKGWDIEFHSESFTEIFEKSSVVYLSSESSNILESLEEDKVYVIGGLVDHNHHKGLCHKLAEQKGLAHAQLPISDYIDMKTRKVLTVNHVFEILLRYTETKDWQKAFYTVLPQRKGAKPKLQNSFEISPKIEPDQENDDICSDRKAENDSTCSNKQAENDNTCSNKQAENDNICGNKQSENDNTCGNKQAENDNTCSNKQAENDNTSSDKQAENDNTSSDKQAENDT